MTSNYSIMLPVRNGGAYLKECVNSILNQSVSDFTLHILDNASTDGSADWIRSLGDSRIRLCLSTKPLTIEENWSRILEVDKNEFMTMIGHDDILHKHYLEEMESLISAHPTASLYQSHFNYIDGSGLVTRKCLPMDEIQKAHEFLACQMNFTIDSTGTGYMMRSKDFDEVGGMSPVYPNLIFSDYELWIRLASKSYKATSLRECFLYREHLSVSRVTNGEQYERAFREYVSFLSRLKDKNEFAVVIERYGKNMLLQFCESLCHRVLKSSRKMRRIGVQDVINNFHDYARALIPDEIFDPLQKKGIRYAVLLDKSTISQELFRFIRKLK